MKKPHNSASSRGVRFRRAQGEGPRSWRGGGPLPAEEATIDESESAVEPSAGADAFPDSNVDAEELALVLALRLGNPGAAVAVYQRLYPFVQRALRRVLRGHMADYDDLIQISFERIMNTLIDGRYRGECSLPGWAMSIASHAALDSLRACKRERRLVDLESQSGPEFTKATSVDAERSLIARSELDRLQDTLSRMRPLDARVLLLRHGFGCSLAETAAALGSTQHATASRLARARRELLRRASHFHADAG